MSIVMKKLFSEDVVRIELSIEISEKEKSDDETIIILLYILFRGVFV